MENTQNKSTFLKVVSIIIVVFAGIDVITSLLSIAGIAALISLGIGTAILYLALVLTIVGCVVYFIAGIKGIGGSNDVAKATKCKVWGYIMIGLQVLSTIISLIGGQKFGDIAFGLIIGLVLPVLYIIAIAQFEKQAA